MSLERSSTATLSAALANTQAEAIYARQSVLEDFIRKFLNDYTWTKEWFENPQTVSDVAQEIKKVCPSYKMFGANTDGQSAEENIFEITFSLEDIEKTLIKCMRTCQVSDKLEFYMVGNSIDASSYPSYTTSEMDVSDLSTLAPSQKPVFLFRSQDQAMHAAWCSYSAGNADTDLLNYPVVLKVALKGKVDLSKTQSLSFDVKEKIVKENGESEISIHRQFRVLEVQASEVEVISASINPKSYGFALRQMAIENEAEAIQQIEEQKENDSLILHKPRRG